jgi:hypothetical protein
MLLKFAGLRFFYARIISPIHHQPIEQWFADRDVGPHIAVRGLRRNLERECISRWVPVERDFSACLRDLLRRNPQLSQKCDQNTARLLTAMPISTDLVSINRALRAPPARIWRAEGKW